MVPNGLGNWLVYQRGQGERHFSIADFQLPIENQGSDLQLEIGNCK
jgi:hypothetical protein